MGINVPLIIVPHEKISETLPISSKWDTPHFCLSSTHFQVYTCRSSLRFS